MFRSPSVAIFREVFYEEYIAKTSEQMYSYNILCFKCVVQNVC